MPFESYRVACVIENPADSARKLIGIGFTPTLVEDAFELEGDGFVLEARVLGKIIEIEFAYDNSILIESKFLEITQLLWKEVVSVYLASAIEKDNIEFSRSDFFRFECKFKSEIASLRNLWSEAFGFKGKKTYVRNAYDQVTLHS